MFIDYFLNMLKLTAIAREYHLTVLLRFATLFFFNPLPPSDAVRKQKKYFRGSFQFGIVTLLKYHPSGNLKFSNLSIF